MPDELEVLCQRERAVESLRLLYSILESWRAAIASGRSLDEIRVSFHADVVGALRCTLLLAEYLMEEK